MKTHALEIFLFSLIAGGLISLAFFRDKDPEPPQADIVAGRWVAQLGFEVQAVSCKHQLSSDGYADCIVRIRAQPTALKLNCTSYRHRRPHCKNRLLNE